MRSNGILIAALIVFAAGGARYLPSLVTAPAAQSPPSSTTQSSHSASIAPTPHDSSNPDALTLLGDYLDVNVSSATDPLVTLYLGCPAIE